MVVSDSDSVQPEDTNPNGSARKKTGGVIQDNKLRIAGIGQIAADTALLSYGAATGNLKVGSVGALGYAAGVVGARYGNPKSEKQLQLVEQELGTYLRKQGVEIPKDPSLEVLTKPGGIGDHVESFLYSHPSQLMNSCFGLMGVQFARSGIQHNQKALIASGGLLISGALAGLLIKEKPVDPEHPPQTALEKTLSWIQEKPLRLTGILLNLNQVSLTVDALQERARNPGKNAYMLKLLAVAGFTLCNTMLGLSSKGHSGNEMDEEMRQKLAEASVRVIAAQPKQAQEALLDHIAGFLATQPNIHMKAQDISNMLHQKMAEILKANPDINWQQQVSTTNGTSPSL